MIEVFAFNPPKSATRSRGSARKGRSPKKFTASPKVTWLKRGATKPAAKNARRKTTKGTKTMAKLTKAARSRAAKKGWARRKRKGWKGQRKAHSVAAHIGRARKRRTPFKYLSKKGVKRKSFISYRKRHKVSWRKGVKRATASPIFMKIAGKRTRYAANRPKRRRYKKNTYRSYVKRYRSVPRAAAAWRRYKKNRPTKRRRKSTRRRVRRNRARYQIAPVAANRYRYQIAPVAANKYGYNRRKRTRKYRRNAGYRYGLPARFANNPMAAAMDFPKRILTKDFFMQNVIPFAGGAIGSKIISYQIAKVALKGTNFDKFYGDAAWKQAAWEAGAGILGGTAIGVLTKGKYTDFAMKFAAGAMLTAILTIVEGQPQLESVRKYYGMPGMNGFGADIESELKKQIAEELRTDLDDFVTTSEIQSTSPLPTLGGFVTAEDIPTESPQVTLSDFMTAPLM